MTLTEFAVNKKYTTVAVVLAVILLGTAGYFSLETKLNPDIDPVVVTITTTYQGATAQDISDLINQPLEEDLGTIEGVEQISSKAMEGTSIINVEFDYSKDINVAAVDVQNVVNRVRNDHPAEISEPEVKKFNSADKPILTLAIAGDYSLTRLRSLTDNELVTNLQLVNGVAAVNTFGGHKREIYISVEQDKLELHDISFNQLLAKINGENITVPGGRITKENSEYLVRTQEKFASLSDIEQLVVANRNGALIKLQDIAEVIDSYEDLRSGFRVQGQEAVAINIIKQQDANTIEVVNDLKEEIASLERQFPELKFTITDDQSDLVNIVINNLSSSLRIGIILTMILIFLFLNNWRNTLAVSVSIPLTFLLTLALLKLFGLTLNSTTMTGLILAIGMLVDDSIVVIENITRHFEELEKTAVKAAIEGTNEIAVATIAGSTTSIVVLLPVMFVGGFIQQMFRPLSMTLLFAWTGSLVTALTVIPLIMAVVLKRRDQEQDNIFHRLIENFRRLIDYTKDMYLSVLDKVLANRMIVITVGISLLVISFSLLPLIGSRMVPVMDSGQIYISIESEPGSSLAKTTEITKETEKIIAQIPEVNIYSSQLGAEPGSSMSSITGANGVQQSFISVLLSDRNQRQRDIWEIQAEIRAKMSQIPGIRSYVVRETGSTAVSTTKAPLVVRLEGENSEVLEKQAQRLMSKLKGTVGATNITTVWTMASPEYQLDINQLRATELGVTSQEIAQQVATAINGVETASDYKLENKEDIAMRLRYNKEARADKDDITDIMITTPQGQVPFKELGEVKLVTGANLITRENSKNILDIIGYTKGRPLSKVTGDWQSILDDFKLPQGYEVNIAGEKNDLVEARGRLLVSLILAIAFVYLLLVAQFKSFLHPFTIMLAIPLELIGVIGGLLLTGKYLSMPAIMGLILLTGIAVNDAIHLIEFAIINQEDGLAPKEAIFKAAKLRFRPIIMTTLSTDVGMLPLALELAVGAEKYSPLAIVVIGGLTASTFLLLFIIPVVYTLLEDLKRKFI
jgi:CzcA family heavy metal efflux pump